MSLPPAPKTQIEGWGRSVFEAMENLDLWEKCGVDKMIYEFEIMLEGKPRWKVEITRL